MQIPFPRVYVGFGGGGIRVKPIVETGLSSIYLLWRYVWFYNQLLLLLTNIRHVNSSANYRKRIVVVGGEISSMVGMSDVNGCDKVREEAMSKYRSRDPCAGGVCQSLHKPKSPHALRSTVLDK